MALPASPNSIGMGQVNVELGFAVNTTKDLNNSAVRNLAVKPTNLSTISMNDLRGKSAATSYPSPGTTDMNVYGANASTTANATILYRPDGTFTKSGSNATTASGRWLVGSNGSSYQFKWRVVENYGNQPPTSSVAENTWTTVSSNMNISAQDADLETLCEADVEVMFREIANTANTVTYIFTISADGRCFAYGTMMRTPYGDRAVETLSLDDLVSSFTEETMLDQSQENWDQWFVESLDGLDVNATSRVVGAHHFSAERSIKINGIHSTLSHVYFVERGGHHGWLKAQDITQNDRLINSDRQLVDITSIELVNEPTMFVGLNVEEADTLQVKCGDEYILAHNIS